MQIDNKFFYPGEIIYNTFNIDFEKPLIAQLDELNEDLIQVKYKGGYLLDIGWYPESDVKGRIIIQLICNAEWNEPIIKEEIEGIGALYNSIDRIISIMKNVSKDENE